MNVHDNRMVDVLHCRERINQRVDIVALFHIAVVKADRAEQVQLARSVRPAELVNVPVDSAVGLRNRHLIVVEYDDEIGSHLCNVIEAFKCLAARQGAVSEKCDHILRSALKVAGLGKARRKRHGGRGVADAEAVMRALAMIGETDVLTVGSFLEEFSSSGQRLVGIALVRNVEDNLVLRRVKHIVERNLRFHGAEVRAEMAADIIYAADNCFPDFGRQFF